MSFAAVFGSQRNPGALVRPVVDEASMRTSPNCSLGVIALRLDMPCSEHFALNAGGDPMPEVARRDRSERRANSEEQETP